MERSYLVILVCIIPLPLESSIKYVIGILNQSFVDHGLWHDYLSDNSFGPKFLFMSHSSFMLHLKFIVHNSPLIHVLWCIQGPYDSRWFKYNFGGKASFLKIRHMSSNKELFSSKIFISFIQYHLQRIHTKITTTKIDFDQQLTLVNCWLFGQPVDQSQLI